MAANGTISRIRISIHAPHTGRDLPITDKRKQNRLFQSTRPIRGATIRTQTWARWPPHFNPRAPYGARRSYSSTVTLWANFNPRAPYGARLFNQRNKFFKILFQSTRPIRGATAALFAPVYGGKHFNPRAPYGARLFSPVSWRSGFSDFNPRAPYGARLGFRRLRAAGGRISIHAPHTGRDVLSYFDHSSYHDISIHAPHTGRDS